MESIINQQFKIKTKLVLKTLVAFLCSDEYQGQPLHDSFTIIFLSHALNDHVGYLTNALSDIYFNCTVINLFVKNVSFVHCFVSIGTMLRCVKSNSY